MIFELEKSDMFPDFCSVLNEAIVNKINLNELHIDSENIDNFQWQSFDLSLIYFSNCSMKKNVFSNCTGVLNFSNCNLSHSKINNSNFNSTHISDSIMNAMNIKNSSFINSFIIASEIQNTTFWNTNLSHIGFHTCTLSNSLFYNCDLSNSSFIHSLNSILWYKDTKFIECKMDCCNMSSVTSINEMYFWNTNIELIEFSENEKFTIIENTNSKVIYAIESNIIWWLPHHTISTPPKIPFRQTLDEFICEIKQGFPTSDIHPEMSDLEVEYELCSVAEYLKYWQRSYVSICKK